MKRLPEYHESFPALQTKQAAVQAGFGGEQELDKIFERYPFSMEYQVFHDLSLFTSAPFQLDTLFITPWYAIVFEVKNMSGELLVTENPPQLIRTLESGQVSRFKSPFTQLENNCALFTDWLSRRSVSLPVYGVIVLAYPRQHIEVFDTTVPILFPQAVPAFIRKLPSGVPLLDKAVFADLLVNLQKSHRQFIPPPICTTFSIPSQHIQTGVICPNCHRLGMKKYTGGWRCLSCGKTSRHAHKQAIREWFLLFGGAMRNQDCRHFLHVERQQTAHRLLTSMELEKKGSYRDRTYSMRFDTEQRT
ncbi:nuclease-related domain-containing protein [Sporosarcina sp. NCCP-2222]|uniref:nuclease-related domain-containing protein n=1 Tax=Sporosarcina sp. NCCP-2222 TaxID=2935073 RepID=UPI0020C08DF9|nr:nuclease-related domain-containing protein [Sporosarcina sp. NCCP-2222]